MVRCHLQRTGVSDEALPRQQGQVGQEVPRPGRQDQGCKCGSHAHAWRYPSVSCYHPLKAFRTPHGVVFSELARYDIIGDIKLPCGRCQGCRLRRAQDWTLRVMHEASQWERNCFVTLTYKEELLPPDRSLQHRDFQLFMKRLRKYQRTPVRFFMAGEYGPLNLRPHYHACLFNVDFSSDSVPAGKSGAGAVFYDSPTLSKLWSYGRVSVQPLTRETAGYCARYIMSKRLGRDKESFYESVDEDGVIVSRAPEYAAMSLKPGIGAEWYAKFGRDVYPHDFVIADGTKFRPPKYYDKLLKRSKALCLDDIEFARELRAREGADEQTPERLAVREQVFLAKISTLQRNNDL